MCEGEWKRCREYELVCVREREMEREKDDEANIKSTER